MGKPTICICETKTQISFTVTAKLISAFVFATRIVQSLFYLNPKFQASSSFLCLYRSVCVGPVRKPHCWFSHEAAQILGSTRPPGSGSIGTPFSYSGEISDDIYWKRSLRTFSTVFTLNMKKFLPMIDWRKDSRLIVLYKGLKGKARIPTDDLIPKNRRCRNQHSLAFQIPSAI